ncbi:hypothetical protein, partial [Streptococcus anginosus]|uniref:hypothetical protein n=1 Tax=Streptococcus anginosus TaxID=1328 RepID=UPI002ED85F77
IVATKVQAEVTPLKDYVQELKEQLFIRSGNLPANIVNLGNLAKGNIMDRPTFDPNQDDNPKVFITDLNNYFQAIQAR